MQNQKLSCLIVDDEMFIRRLASEYFQRSGFQCHLAADGDEASKLLATNSYDCAVIDLQIPGKNGHALCVEAMQLPRTPILAIITGLAVPQIEEDLRRRGVKHFFHKPVSMKDIAETMRNIVEEQITQTEPQSDDRELAASSPGGFPAPAAETATASQTDRFVVLVFCREQERTQRIAGLLEENSYTAIPAGSSDEVLDILNTRRVDLLVIEKKLRGFLNGLQIVESLFEQLISMNVVLLADDPSEKLPESSAMECISQRLKADLTDEDVVREVIKVAKSLSGQHLVISEEARRLVYDAEQIPPMPHVLAKIIQYLDQPVDEISLDALSRDIEIDARLTSELLRLTNSSSSGIAHKVTAVRDAVRLLGAKRAITLCLALGVRTMNSELLKHWGDELRGWYLKRVALTSAVASLVAERFEKVPPDSAFLLGILQDIGILVFAEHYGVKYFDKVVQRVRSMGTLTLSNSERMVTNTDHAEVSAAVLRLWKFPPTIIQPVLLHHQPIDATQSKMSQSFIRCMQLAELFADFADNPAAQGRQRLNRYLSANFPDHRDECGTLLMDAVSQMHEISKQFDTPAPAADELEAAIAQLTRETDDEDTADDESNPQIDQSI